MSVYIAEWLRDQIFERAEGQCEYCLIPQISTFVPHQIDHIIARKHGGLTTLENLALTCAICNRFKGSDLTSIDSQTGYIVELFRPRSQLWAEHFTFRDGMILPLSATGRVTVDLLQMNRPERVVERRVLFAEGFFKVPNVG